MKRKMSREGEGEINRNEIVVEREKLHRNEDRVSEREREKRPFRECIIKSLGLPRANLIPNCIKHQANDPNPYDL